jgi:CHAT domain-containing protein
LNREIETILEDLRNTSVEIQRVIPAYSALTDLKPVTAEKIRGLVDSETLLLEFALGDEISYLWLVSDQKVLSFDLPGRSQIEKIALEALNKITERNRSKVEKRIPVRIQRERDADKEYMQLSKQLSRILLGPVANQLASKRLVIVADGVLQYFPFSALPRPELPIGSDQWEPLILNHEVVVLPSASALSSIRETLSNRTPAPQLLAVITDPVYEPKPKKDQQNGARGTASARTGLALRQLGFAKREIRAIKDSVRKADPEAELKIWDRFEANLKNATSAELKMYRIIHYSAHGKLDGSRPESSGIVLALYDAGGKPVPDFFMGLRDVYHLRLFADLVVLSACESALGKEVKGEGIVGLTRGFMYAGSKRVVSSLWEVDEFQTSDLMALLYQNLLEQHMTVPSALQAAQVFMWQKRKLPPYYWAAFHMQGEWQGKLRP